LQKDKLFTFPLRFKSEKYKIQSMSEEAIKADINGVKTRQSAKKKKKARTSDATNARKIKEAVRLENAFGISLRVRRVDSDIEPMNLDALQPPKREGYFLTPADIANCIRVVWFCRKEQEEGSTLETIYPFERASAYLNVEKEKD
jgi:hypothetical protein